MIVRRLAANGPCRQFLRTLSTSAARPQSTGAAPTNPADPKKPEPLYAKEIRPIDDGVPFTLAEDFSNFQRFRNTTGKLGAVPGKYEYANRSLNSPPRPKDVTLELLMSAGAHLGHATSLWNPGNQRNIFGVWQGIHIIALEQTAAHLRRAAKIVEGVCEKGGLVLFVGSRPGQERAVVEAARLTNGCHLFEKWIPGTITNGKMIVGHGSVIEMDSTDAVSPHGPKPGAAPVRPDLVVCLNPLENYVLLHECGLFAIPTIGIIDTDADPTWVTYPIPANDDSIRSVQLISGVLARAGEAGKQKRIRRAQRNLAQQM